jgi:hypothetical protein
MGVSRMRGRRGGDEAGFIATGGNGRIGHAYLKKPIPGVPIVEAAGHALHYIIPQQLGAAGHGFSADFALIFLCLISRPI